MYRLTLNLLPKSICILLLTLVSLGLNAQSPNILLKRDFWENHPSIEAVKTEIKKGSDPTALNSNAFDAVVYAILEKAPLNILQFLMTFEGNGANKLTHDGRTYIFWAAYTDNLELMTYLVSKGAKMDIIDDHGYSVLNFAAVTGQQNPQLYDFMFAKGAQAKLEKDRDGANALLLLIPHLKDPEMLHYLVNKGLDLNSKDSDGNGAFNYAAKSGNLLMMDWLIEQGVTHNGPNKKGGNAMFFASRGMRKSSNSLNVFTYLEKRGIKPNLTAKNGETPLLLYAASGKEVNVIEYFISKGINPNQIEKETKNNALMNAAKNGSFEIVELLIKHTEDINAANKKGETALTNAMHRGSSEMVSLLIANGAELNIEDKNGNSLIYYWVQSYNPKKESDFKEKQAILINNGIDLSQPQPNGNSFFHLAAQRNDLRLLMKAKELELDINNKNKEGLTPLHIAAMKANTDEILKYLISLGADKSIRTHFEESAYDIAHENEVLTAKHIEINFLKN